MNIAPKINGVSGRHIPIIVKSSSMTTGAFIQSTVNTSTTPASHLAIGDGASVTGANVSSSIAIGTNATVSNDNSIAIGSSNINPTNTFYNTLASGISSLAIGSGDQASYAGAKASGNAGIAIGNAYQATYAGASAGGLGSIAIGSGANAGGAGSIVMGINAASSSGSYLVLLGRNATGTGNFSIGIGNSANIGSATQITAIGGGVIASAATSTLVGYGTQVKIGATNATAIGDNITVGNNVSTGVDSTNVGTHITTQSNYNVNIGGYSGSNNTTSDYSICIGYNVTTNATNTINIATPGGIANPTNTVASSVYFGFGGKPDFVGEFAYSPTQAVASGQGGIKGSWAILNTQTADATVTELGAGVPTAATAPTNRIVLTNDSTYLFDCDIVGRNINDDTQSAAWNLKFAIRRGVAAANTALIGLPTKTIFGMDTGATTWDVSVTADTTNGRPNISVTGEAAKTIRWVANIRMTKCTG